MITSSEQLKTLLDGLEIYRKNGWRILYTMPSDQRQLVNDYLKETGEIDQ